MSESASGEASSDSNQSDKEFSCPDCEKDYQSRQGLHYHLRNTECSSHPCPTCGKEYSTRLGVKTHHKQTHDVSLSGVKTTCHTCGDTMRIAKHRIENNERVYCSKDCQADYLSSLTGEDHYHATGDKLPCDNCGKLVYTPNWQQEQRDYHYCSDECKYEHSPWADNQETNRLEKTCEICGSSFEVIAFRKDTAKYCSKDCRIEATRRITGEERYNYKGEYDSYYGPNWYRQKRKAWKRDQYRCRVCGATERELSRRPSVHHIKPMWWFKENFDAPEWYEKGNTLNNLITLCEPHHKPVEGWFLRPDTS